MQKKKQHTVPRSYLEKFADQSGMVWVLQQSEDGEKIFKTRPENILTGNNFYTIKVGTEENAFIIEDTLANIEGSFATIFREKIDKNLPLTQEEKVHVSIFVATLLHRTKGAREAMLQGFVKLDQDLEDWRKQFEALSPKASALSSAMPRGDGPSFNQRDVKEVIEKMDDYHSTMLIEALPELATLIFQMGWGIISPENPSDEFITSDHPVSMLRPDSIKKYGPNALGSTPAPIYEDVEISVPLSSKKLLLMGWKIEDDGQIYLSLPKPFVEQVNLRTIMYHDEKLVASSKEKIEEVQALMQELKQKYPPEGV